MSERTSTENAKKMGRPGLSDAQKQRVYEVLGREKKGTDGYRRARLFLAVETGRTERAVELVFERAHEDGAA